MTTLEQLRTGCLGMNVTLTAAQEESLLALCGALLEANHHLNLTAIRDEPGVIEKHLLDSLTLLALPLPAEAKTLLDLGCGAGFPGLPLAICRPDIQVTLLDAHQKKLRFVEDMIARFGLANARTCWRRAEDAGHDGALRENFDVVVARAVAELPVLCEYALPLVGHGGTFIAMKGKSAHAELAAASHALACLGARYRAGRTILPGNVNWDHTLLVFDKVRPTPAAYPRKNGAPSRAPL